MTTRTILRCVEAKGYTCRVAAVVEQNEAATKRKEEIVIHFLTLTAHVALRALALGIVGIAAAALQVGGEARTTALVQSAAVPRIVVSRWDAEKTLLAEGWRVTAEEASKLESELSADPENLALRGRLISYYTQYMISAPRTAHLLWMIESHPEASIFGLDSVLTSVVQDWTGLNTAVNAERARALWLQQVDRFPANTKVLINAALAFSHSEPRTSVDLALRARAVEPDNPEWVSWLGKIYARAVRASFAGGPQRIRAFAFPGNDRNDRLAFSLPLAESEWLKNELETSEDAELIGMTGEALVLETSSLGARGKDEELAASGAFGKRLLSRAQQLDPKNPRWKR